jgi:hypothetical protein
MKIVLVTMVALMLITAGCIGKSENGTPPVYSGPTVSDELPSIFQKTNIRDLELLLGQKLPVPTDLPSGYGIKEVYYAQRPQDIPPTAIILILISDQEVAWIGNRYTCRLMLEIDWNATSLGLKEPWAEYVPAIRGRLGEWDGEYVLRWEIWGVPESWVSTLRLHASQEIPKEELVKIAASTLPDTSS